MPPVAALPQKPQPSEQREGADVSAGGWLDSMDALRDAVASGCGAGYAFFAGKGRLGQGQSAAGAGLRFKAERVVGAWAGAGAGASVGPIAASSSFCTWSSATTHPSSSASSTSTSSTSSTSTTSTSIPPPPLQTRCGACFAAPLVNAEDVVDAIAFVDSDGGGGDGGGLSPCYISYYERVALLQRAGARAVIFGNGADQQESVIKVLTPYTVPFAATIPTQTVLPYLAKLFTSALALMFLIAGPKTSREQLLIH